MFRLFIATRNVIITVLLSWIGMGFADSDNKQDAPQEKPEAASFLGFR